MLGAAAVPIALLFHTGAALGDVKLTSNMLNALAARMGYSELPLPTLRPTRRDGSSDHSVPKEQAEPSFDIGNETRSGRNKFGERDGHICHAFKLGRVSGIQRDQRRFQEFMGRPAGASDIHQEGAEEGVSQSLILIEKLYIVEITRMLAVERCVELAPEKVVEGHDKGLCEAEAIFHRFSNAPLCWRMHDAAHDRRDFDLYFGSAAPCENSGVASSAARYPLCSRTRNRGFDSAADALESGIDFRKAFRPSLHGQVAVRALQLHRAAQVRAGGTQLETAFRAVAAIEDIKPEAVDD